MKKNRSTGLIIYMGILGAMLGPYVGWAMSGYNRFKDYYRYSFPNIIIWTVICFLVVFILGGILVKLDEISKRGNGDGKSKQESD